MSTVVTSTNTNFPTSEDLYYRLKTDPTFLESKAIVVYFDIVKNKYFDVPLIKWTPISKGGDIPFHKVYYFKYNNVIIWDRTNKICKIDELIDQLNNRVEILLNFPFKILTLNVMSDIYQKQITNMDKRADAICSYLLNSDADIICLQEIMPKFGLILESKLGSIYDISKTDLEINNIWILSKSTIQTMSIIKLGPAKEVLCADISTSNSEIPIIKIYGVHLTSDSSPNAQTKREMQLQIIKSKLDFDSDFIILGDFNCASFNIPVLTELTDICTKFDNSDACITYDPDINIYAKQLNLNPNKRRLDRILFNSNLLNPTNAVSDKVEVSDHYPMIGTFDTNHESDIIKSGIIQSINSDIVHNKFALAAIIPYKHWNFFNDIRKKHDKAYVSWSPHINIIFPFIDRIEFDKYHEKIHTIVKKYLPFEIEITEFSYFVQPTSHTLYAKLDKTSSMILEKIYMDICKLVQITILDYVPHITLGQFKSLEEIEPLLKKQFPKLNMTIESLHFISKEKTNYYLTEHIVGNMTFGFVKLVELLGPNYKICVGGSNIFTNNRDTIYDYDLVVIGNEDRNTFMQQTIELLEKTGYFINVDLIKNEHIEYIKFRNYNTHFDIHYIKMKNIAIQIDQSLLSSQEIQADPKSVSALSVILASKAVLDHMNNEKKFVHYLDLIKKAAKNANIYGQQYGYLPGLAWAVLVAVFLRTGTHKYNNNDDSDNDNKFIEEFCKFYASYDYSKPITLVPNMAIELTKQDRHIKIMCPIEPYTNIPRTMTKSTMVRTLDCFKTGFVNVTQISKITKTTIKVGTNNRQMLKSFFQWYNSVFTKMILAFEHLNIDLYPQDSWTNKKNITDSIYKTTVAKAPEFILGMIDRYVGNPKLKIIFILSYLKI
jgi:endonuclease/exonuclease/phosphatase family metal-dependent hydrolase/2'-5' RNA ligase